LAAFLPAATTTAYGAVVRNPALPWDHAFVRLEAAWWRAPAALAEALATACAAVGLNANADPMPPYNLLLTRDWLLVVPRSRDQWDGISVNALGFAGSLFVRRAEDIERLRADGPLRLLAGVARRTR
jgi:ATP adenylyltransferase